MQNRRNSGGSSFPDRKALVDAYWQFHNQTHRHDRLRLESASPGQPPLPEELRHESRDKYRIVMTMILSPRKSDIQLAPCLGRFFKMHPSFDSLRNVERGEGKQLLGAIQNGGIGLGYNDPDNRSSSGARLWY